jgi:hypothetical protein
VERPIEEELVESALRRRNRHNLDHLLSESEKSRILPSNLKQTIACTVMELPGKGDRRMEGIKRIGAKF